MLQLLKEQKVTDELLLTCKHCFQKFMRLDGEISEVESVLFPANDTQRTAKFFAVALLVLLRRHISITLRARLHYQSATLLILVVFLSVRYHGDNRPYLVIT